MRARVYSIFYKSDVGDGYWEIRGVVAEELEEKFRKLAMKRFGYGKGSLSKALECARGFSFPSKIFTLYKRTT